MRAMNRQFREPTCGNAVSRRRRDCVRATRSAYHPHLARSGAYDLIRALSDEGVSRPSSGRGDVGDGAASETLLNGLVDRRARLMNSSYAAGRFQEGNVPDRSIVDIIDSFLMARRPAVGQI